MDSLQQQLMFTGISLLCASIGSFHDLRERRIPNYVTAPSMAAGCVLHMAFGGGRGLEDSVLAGFIAGGIFLLFFLAGGMGAGDVKLMTAVGCIAGLSPLRMIVIATAIAGGLFSLAVSSYHGRLRETLRGVVVLIRHHGSHGFEPHQELNLSNSNTIRLPFALPIAAGCLFAAVVLAREVHP
jgi:prepilin peptidase CpaA